MSASIHFRAFSTSENDPKVEASVESKVVEKPKIKATAKAGYKMPRLKKGDEIIGFRPSGHTALTQPTLNYNFNLAQEEQVKNKNRFVMAIVLFSFIPFFLFVKNAEGNFRRTEIKKIAEKRRRKLDAEHNIDRDE